MGKIHNTEYFINKSKKVHGDTYTYEKTNYTGCFEKVIITCKIHGDFLQQPRIHTSGSHCLKCAEINRINNRTKTTEDFVKDSMVIHGERYSYTDTIYVGALKKLTISCYEHGDFYIRPSDHLAGGGCPVCFYISKTYNLSDFVKKAKEVHGNKYTYTKSVYVKSNEKVVITCKIHGDFNVAPSIHLYGGGCRKCGMVNNGWTRTDFVENCKRNNGGFGTFYILKCYDKSECFYKVGITSKSIPERYKSKSAMPYNYDVILDLTLLPEKVYDAEKRVLKRLSKYSYEPSINFAGYTECFSKLEPILRLLEGDNLMVK